MPAGVVQARSVPDGAQAGPGIAEADPAQHARLPDRGQAALPVARQRLPMVQEEPCALLQQAGVVAPERLDGRLGNDLVGVGDHHQVVRGATSVQPPQAHVTLVEFPPPGEVYVVWEPLHHDMDDLVVEWCEARLVLQVGQRLGPAGEGLHRLDDDKMVHPARHDVELDVEHLQLVVEGEDVEDPAAGMGASTRGRSASRSSPMTRASAVRGPGSSRLSSVRPPRVPHASLRRPAAAQASAPDSRMLTEGDCQAAGAAGPAELSRTALILARSARLPRLG